MEWYLNVLRQYADFKGRARRKEYWMFMLFHLLIICVLAGIAAAVEMEGMENFLLGSVGCYYLATIIPSLAVTVRRLHDVGHSGWMYLVSFIPLIGPFWILVLTVSEGDRGTNQYGPDPKVGFHVERIEEIGR